MKREIGHYWICPKGETVFDIGFWDGAEWFFCGIHMCERAFDEVDERRIIRTEPNKLYFPSMETVDALVKGRADVETTATWKRLFDEYNADNEKKLHMGCRPCYAKVFQWHRVKSGEIKQTAK